MISKNPHWDDLTYHRMTNARFDGGNLTVDFEDGDHVVVTATRLLPFDAGPPAWQEISFDPYEIVIPTASGAVVIPWSTLRLLTDPAYARFVAAGARDYAVRMGRRIRELRQARGLSGRELAQRAGITPNNLSRIELGRHTVTLSTLGNLLAAMGYSYRDLAELAPEATPV